MLGLIELIANQSSSQRKITMQERHLYWYRYFFPWPRSSPAVFLILESPLVIMASWSDICCKIREPCCVSGRC